MLRDPFVQFGLGAINGRGCRGAGVEPRRAIGVDGDVNPELPGTDKAEKGFYPPGTLIKILTDAGLKPSKAAIRAAVASRPAPLTVNRT